VRLVLWVFPLVCATVGLAVLAWFALQAGREIDPTRSSIDRFGREVRPALLRVRDESSRTRRRFDGER
jgi:hypothetical protein